MANYGKASYWDERYTKDPEPFDWYQRYDGLKDLLSQYLKKKDRILQSGCGNSRLTEEMDNDGYHNIVNIDSSKVVIENMRDTYKERTTLSWQIMNCTAMDFKDGSFDAIVDKGTLDSILCGEGSTANVAKYCRDASRVLTEKGVFFIVSYGVPDNRLSYLENEEFGWKVNVHDIPKPTVSATNVADTKDASSKHYVYVCVKGGNDNDDDEEGEEKS